MSLMQPRLQMILIISSVIFFFFVLELIRRGHLREEYSLIWLLGAALVFFFGVFEGSMQFVASLIQIEYGPSFIFALGLGLMGFILLMQATAISRLTSQSRDLAQDIGILDLRIKQLSTRASLQQIAELTKIPMRGLEAISKFLRGCNRLDDLLLRTLDLTLKKIKAKSGNILVTNIDGDIIGMHSFYNGSFVAGKPNTIADTIDHGLAGWVMNMGRAALVTSTREDPRWLRRPWDEEGKKTRSAICAPLIVDDRVAGVFTLVQEKSDGFGTADLALLMAIATIFSRICDELLKSSINSNAVVGLRDEVMSSVISEHNR